MARTVTYPELDALRAQVRVLDELLAELGPVDWERSTRCPPWTVRELFGHVVGTIRLGNQLLQEIDAEPDIDRFTWNVGAERTEADQELVRQGTAAYVKGKTPDDLLADWQDTKRTMLDGLDGDPNRTIGSEGRRVIRRADLAARNVRELGIHTMDLGHATLRGERIAPEAVRVIVETLDGQLASPLPKGLGWSPQTYVLTGTGRRRLEPNERYTLGPLAERFPLIR